jgi:RimJ/RimL family protein N-acetyltransferase
VSDARAEVRRNEHGQPIGAPVPGWSGAAPPARVSLVGASVRLDPVAVEHAEALYTALCGPDNASLWTYRPAAMPPDLSSLQAVLAAAASDPATVTFAIVPAGGEMASGLASLMRVDAAQGAVEVGAIIYAASLQRTRAATEAMWLLMRHVFDDLGYRRYEWKCDSLNEPSRVAAARLGFRYEGRFRQAMVYQGRNRDTDWFSITDDDWSRLAPAYDDWLASSNFDGAGRQRVSLGTLTARALEPPATA